MSSSVTVGWESIRVMGNKLDSPKGKGRHDSKLDVNFLFFNQVKCKKVLKF